MTFSLSQIAEHLGAEIVGNADCRIECIATLANATVGCISFLSNKKYRAQLADCRASAVLIHPAQLSYCQSNSDMTALVVDDPYLAYALLARLMDTTPSQAPGIAPSAVVDVSAVISPGASIGANAVISAAAHIGEGAIIGAGCFIGERSSVGQGTRLWANVSVYHGVSIGQDCLFQSGVVIGSDGFGYAPQSAKNDKNADKWLKIPQLGGVTIGDRVEVGSNTTIDRGALDDTVIGNGVIIDDHCHVAHNVIIGEHTAMAGGAMIAGSTTIGAGCTIAGKAGIAGHLLISANVVITSMSQVIKDIPEPGIYSSGMGTMPNRQWRKVNARIRQLDGMYKNIRDNSKAIEQLQRSEQAQEKSV